MDQETLYLSWPDAPALLAELRTLGGNVAPARFAGLRTPRWRRQLLAALEAGLDGAPPGRPALRIELVYGHALRAAPRPRVQAETQVSLQDMRRMVRAPRR
jgi:malonyl-CoA O-methyltransferase